MFVPAIAQVVPVRIPHFDKLDLLLSTPAFDLLLAVYRTSHVIKALEVNQAANMEMAGEALERFIFVLPYTLIEIAGQTGVADTRRIGDDIDVIEVFLHSKK